MRKRIIIVLFVVIAIGGVFASLRSKGDNIAAGRAATRQVSDSSGRKVTIPERPQKVVILSAAHVDLFCAAGGKDFLFGKPVSQVMSEETKTATAKTKEIGMAMAPNTEVILSINPDLVIGLNVPPHLALIPVFEKAGIPMLIQNLDTYEQVLELTAFYGELAGQQVVAQKRLALIKDEYATALKKSSGQQAPRNVILWGTPDSFSMATKTSFVGDLVERLGGNNIMNDIGKTGENSGFLPLSMEYLSKQNPEVILLITHGAPEGIKEIFGKEIANNPVWKELKAVKNNRMYTLPYQLFAVNPGSRIGQAINILADNMYGKN